MWLIWALFKAQVKEVTGTTVFSGVSRERRRLGFCVVGGVHILGLCFLMAVSFLLCVPCRAHSCDCSPSVSMGQLHEMQQIAVPWVRRCQAVSPCVTLTRLHFLCLLLAGKRSQALSTLEGVNPMKPWALEMGCYLLFSWPSTSSHIK